MTQDQDGPHLYGTPDPKSEEPAPENGLHGEDKAAGEHPEFRHQETLEDGRTVMVEEQSGVAFAEAMGTTGLTPDPAERSAGSDPDSKPVPPMQDLPERKGGSAA